MTGIDDAKATWIAREDSAGAAEDRYEFMHMTFKSVESEGEERIELLPCCLGASAPGPSRHVAPIDQRG